MRSERGFAVLTYLLAALLLMGVLSGVMLLSTNRSQTANQQWSVSTQLVAQANLLRTKLLDCVNQAGNNGSANHPMFPLGSGAAVGALTCPATSQSVFSGTDGVFVPPPPSGFGAWTYTNDAGSVRLRIQTTTPAALASAMQSAVAQLGSPASLQTTTTTNDTFQLILAN